MNRVRNMPHYRGKLIVIDGIDGTGKTTQAQLLLKRLKTKGYRTAFMSFPRHNHPAGALVRKYLRGQFGNSNPYVTSLFYAADRGLAAERIRSWIKENRVVIIDRYVTANMGHQGGKILDAAKRKKFFSWLENLEYKTLGLPKPDLVIILYVPLHRAIKNILLRKKRAHNRHDSHEKSRQHLWAASRAFQQTAEFLPYARYLKCGDDKKMFDVSVIHEKIWRIVAKRLPSSNG